MDELRLRLYGARGDRGDIYGATVSRKFTSWVAGRVHQFHLQINVDEFYWGDREGVRIKVKRSHYDGIGS
jgi:hypothetical protein